MDDDSIHDMFAGLGPVTIRKMFGGKGIYHQGKVLALDIGDEVVLKADAESAPAFRAAGCRQCAHENKDGSKKVAMPYWSIPEDAFDDPDIMAEWVRRAWGAAMRAK